MSLKTIQKEFRDTPSKELFSAVVDNFVVWFTWSYFSGIYR